MEQWNKRLMASNLVHFWKKKSFIAGGIPLFLRLPGDCKQFKFMNNNGVMKITQNIRTSRDDQVVYKRRYHSYLFWQSCRYTIQTSMFHERLDDVSPISIKIHHEKCDCSSLRINRHPRCMLIFSINHNVVKRAVNGCYVRIAQPETDYEQRS